MHPTVADVASPFLPSIRHAKSAPPCKAKTLANAQVFRASTAEIYPLNSTKTQNPDRRRRSHPDRRATRLGPGQISASDGVDMFGTRYRASCASASCSSNSILSRKAGRSPTLRTMTAGLDCPNVLPAVRIRAYSAEKLRLLCGGPSPLVVECSRVASPINAGLRPPPTAADGIDRGCHTAAICLQEVDGKVRSAYPPNFMPENFAAPSLRGS